MRFQAMGKQLKTWSTLSALVLALLSPLTLNPSPASAAAWSSCLSGITNTGAADVNNLSTSASCLIQFKTSNTFTVPDGVTSVAVAIVGGGGGGGFGQIGGGGGGGEVMVNTALAVTPGTANTVAIGSGGAGGWNLTSSAWTGGNRGGTSQFGSVYAGGGFGGLGNTNVSNTPSSSYGGSGGGGNNQNNATIVAGKQSVSGWTSSASNGGSGGTVGGAGGGGAGAAGSTGQNGTGGAGLTLNSIFGLAVTVAGGGGGWVGGTGGTGGGGKAVGANYTVGTDGGTNGTANTGGGGGAGMAGGTGTVYLQYYMPTVSFNANGGTGTMASVRVPTNSTLPANTLTRTGYVFKGWATSASGQVAVLDQASVSLTADTTYYAVWAGTTDYAANLNSGATNDYFSNTGAQIIPASGAFTAEAWVDPAASAGASVILSQGSGTNRFYLKINSANQLVLLRDNGGATEVAVTGVTIPNNSWTHVAAVLDGTNAYVYVNGQLIQTTAYSFGGIQISTGFYVGQYSAYPTTTNTPWKGQLDQVKVWSSALTQAQISRSMNTFGDTDGTGQIAATLAGAFGFNENGATVFDATKNTTLSATGSPTYSAVATVDAVRNIYKFPRTYLTTLGGWVAPSTATYDYLAVAGGGSGGDRSGGGGGAGGLRTSLGTPANRLSISTGAVIPITVGVGGVAFYGMGHGYNGTNSVIGTATAISVVGGGGGGTGAGASNGTGATGTDSCKYYSGNPGGSGGGSDSTAPGCGTTVTAGAGTSQQGNSGGLGSGAGGAASTWTGGGGGGAGSVGGIGNTSGVAGNGGTGLASGISGSNVCYAAGGGGGAYTGYTPGTPGTCAGLASSGGAGSAGDTAAANATPNTGGGGGGSGFTTYNGTPGTGGSGIVVLRASVSSVATPTFDTPVITGSGTGFTANITNFDPYFTYSSSITTGSATISSTGAITVSGLTAGAAFTLTVTASDGVSSSSSTLTPPTAPTALVGKSGDGKITLTFTQASSATAPVANLQYSTNAGTSWTTVAQTAGPIVLSSLTNGTTYNFLVRAGGAGYSSNSTSVSAVPGLVWDVYASNYNATSGVWTDSSANANNVTATGSIPTKGIFPDSVIFNGSTVFSHPTTYNGSTDAAVYSIGAWFKATTSGRIVGFGDANGYDHHMYVGSNGYLYAGLCASSCSVAASNSAVNDGVWRYAVSTFDGTTAKLYINGVLQTTTFTKNGSLVNYTGNWKIGGTTVANWPNAGNGYFTGSIGHAFVYHRALSASEITSMYTAEQAPYTPLAIAFANGGGTGTLPTATSALPSNSYTLPVSALTRAGYYFSGWNDGTSTYSAGSSYTMPASGSVTFTAQWSSNSGTLTYNDSNGGTTTANYLPFGSVTLPSTTRTGYVLKGWSTDAGGTNLVGSGGATYYPTQNTNQQVNYNFGDSTSYVGTGSAVNDVSPNAGGVGATISGTASYAAGSPSYLNISGGSYLQTGQLYSRVGETAVSAFAWIYATADGVILDELGNADLSWHDSQIEVYNGKLAMRMYNGAAITSTATVTNGWHYVGFTFNGNTLTGYLDGAAFATATSYVRTPNPSNSLFYALGKGDITSIYTSAAGTFRLGGFQAWNTGLTATSVANNFQAACGSYSISGCTGQTLYAQWLPVAVAPSVSNPASVAKTVGQAVTFSTTASTTDGGTLSYQWYKGGVAISGATSSSYSIGSVSSGDAGSYSVTVVNTLYSGQSYQSTASTTSSAASLSINTAPTITTPSSGLSATYNSAYSLTVSATANTVGKTFSVTGTLPPGLTLDTATGIISGTPTASGSYAITVTVTDGNGATATTSSFTIAVSAGTQTITFAAIAARNVNSGNFTVSPTTSATGLTVTLASTTLAVCTVSGFTVTVLTSGNCSLTASQAGNANWAAATSVVQVVAIGSTVVTFNSNFGTPTTVTQTATTPGSVALVANTFTRSGYTFAGWNTLAAGGGTAYTDAQSVSLTASVTLYAQWTANTNNVTFNSKGGTAVAGTTYVSGTALPAAPIAPTKPNVTFLGWAATDGGPVITWPYTPAVSGDITLYARWNPMPTSSLVINLDGSDTTSLVGTGTTFSSLNSIAPGSSAITSSGSGNISIERSTNSLNLPVGSTGSYVQYAANNPAAAGGAITVESWIRCDAYRAGTGWNIIATDWFSDTAGTSSNSNTWHFGINNDKLNVYVNTSYSLFGTKTWSSADCAGNTWNLVAFTIDASGNARLYINGVQDGASVLVAPTNHTGSILFIGDPRASVALQGRISKFRYYNTALSAANMLTTFNNESASYGYTQYTVTYKAGPDSTGLDLASGFISGRSVALKDANAGFTRTGYSISGWTTSAVSGAAQTNALSATYSTQADLTLYPVWTANNFTITYNYNGATGGASPASAVFTYGGTALTLPTPTRTGYTFGGWYSDSGFTTSIGAAGASYSPTASGNAYAKWNANTNVVTYDSQLGSAVTAGTFTTGGSITLPAAPTRTGYTFLGWFAASSGGTALVSPYSPSATNAITLYAQWSSSLILDFDATDTNSWTGGNTVTNRNSAYPNLTWTTGTSGGAVSNANQAMTLAGAGSTNNGTFGTLTSSLNTSSLQSGLTIDIYGSLGTTANSWERFIDFAHLKTGGTGDASYNIDVGRFIATNRLFVEIFNQSSGSASIGHCTTLNDVLDGSLHRFTIVLDGSTCRIFKDGVQQTVVNDANSGVTGLSVAYGLPINNVVLDSALFGKSQWGYLGDASTEGSIRSFRLFNSAIVPNSIDLVDSGRLVYKTISFASTPTASLPSALVTTGTLALPLASTATRTGYTLSNWYSDSALTSLAGAPGASYTPSATTTLYAAWTANTYAVTYDSQSGSAVASGSFTTGGTISLPAAPIRAGYTFAGWFAAATGGSSLSSPYTPGVASAITIYAQWTANSFTVTYNYNSATGGNTTSSATFSVGGTAITLPTPTRTGYSFGGWFSDSGLTVSIGAAGASYSPSASVTAYAKWTANSYTVTYNYNSATGGNSTVSDTFTVGGSALTLPTPTRTGYTFGGWYSDSGLTVSIGAAGASYSPLTSGTLYAKWNASSYSVSYDSQLGSAVAAGSFATGGSVTLPAGPTRLGYTFTGWFSAAIGGSALTSPYAPGVTSAITLYAQWAVAQQTINYGANAGTGSVSATTGNTAATVALASGVGFSRSGYTLDHWNTAADNSGTSYALSAASVTMPAGGLALFAIWTANTYTITYDANGGTGTMVHASEPYTTGGIGVSVPGAGALVKSGYTFGGWATTANGTALSGTGATAFTTASDVTLYAVWNAATYTITYNLNGGTGSAQRAGSSITADSYTTGGSTVALPGAGTLAKSGYTFGGWATSAGGAALAGASVSAFTTAADVTVYVVWTPVNYSVTYNSNSADSGTAPIDGANYNIGQNITVRANTGTLTRTGYTFAGWNTAADGTGTTYQSGSQYLVGSSSVTLYAKWTANTYTVTYNANGGAGFAQRSSVTVVSDTYTTAGTAITLPSAGTLAKTGYNFGGWATSANGSALSGTFTTSSNLTLYAVWNIKAVHVYYDKGSASSAAFSMFPSAVNSSYAATVTLSTNIDHTVSFGGQSYDFVGWSDGSSVYRAGGSYQLGESDLTLVAQWVPVFAVRYIFNGGSPSGSDSNVDTECAGLPDHTCTDQQVITANSAPTRAGYSFAGWVDQSGNAVPTAATFIVSATRYLIYATWTPIDYSVGYNADGGSATPTQASRQMGQSFVLANPITKVGYSFGGWSDGNQTYGAGATYSVGTSNVSLTAQWTPNVYSVTYDWNGGRGTAVADDAYTVGTAALTLPGVGDHVKDGYTFNGWSTSPTGNLISNTFTPTAATSLYAIWGAGSYTLNLDANHGSVSTGSYQVANGNAQTLPTPSRTHFHFDGWFDSLSGGSRLGAGGDNFTPTASGTIYAHWTQDSLFGIGANTKLGSQTVTSGIGTTLSATGASNSVAVNYPADALPAGTTLDVYLLSDTSRAASILGTGNSYLVSFVVSWLAADGTVPTTANGKPLTVTITNPAIKAGASVYMLIGSTPTFMGVATVDGSVSVAITDDPELVVVNTVPTAPGTPTATAGNGSVTVSWSAPSSTGGAAITGYTVTSSSGQTCTTTALSCIVTGLTNGSSYTFTVVATNTVGDSAASSASAAVIPQASQTITFAGLSNKTLGQADYAVTATASSSLTVALTSATPLICTISAGTVHLVAAGTCTINADQAGNAAFLAAVQVQQSFTVASGLTLTTPSAGLSGTYNVIFNLPLSSAGGAGSKTFALTAGTLIAGLTLNSATGVISGTPTAAGSASIVVTVTDANGASVATNTFSIAIAKADQASLAVTSTSGTFGTPITLTATGGTVSGALSFVVADNGSMHCTLNNGSLTADGAGSCTVTATMTGDSNYNAVSSAATTVTFAKANQASITVTTISGTYGTALSLAISGGSGTGAVNFQVSAGSTSCTISGTELTATAAGSCQVVATKAADTDYNSMSSASTTVTFAAAGQAAVIVTTTAGTFGTPLQLQASGGSGTGALTFAVTDGQNTTCTLTGNILTASNAGTCIVAATFAADANFNAASSAATTVTFAHAAQAIVFGALPSRTLGTGSATLVASATSSLTVAFTSATTAVCSVVGTTLTLLSAGTCTINADQAGDNQYSAASQVQQSFVVSPALVANTPITGLNGSYLTLFTLNLGVTGGSGGETFALSAGSLPAGLTLNSASGVIEGTPTAAGNYAVTITVTDSNGANASTASFTIVIAKISQAALVLTSTTGTFGTPLQLTVSGGTTGGAVIYSAHSAGANSCTLTNGLLSVSGAGDCLVSATMAGNSNYNAVTSSTTRVTFGKAAQAALSVSTTTGTFGTSLLLGTSGGSGTGAVTYQVIDGSVGCTLASGRLTVDGAGWCHVTATKASDFNYTAVSSADTTVTFAAAGQSAVTVTTTAGTYGSGTTLQAIGGSSTGAFSFTFSNGSTICSLIGSVLTAYSAGTCFVTATKAADANYTAAESVPTLFTFVHASQSISFGALGSQTLGMSSFTISATATSGLVVNFSSATPSVCTVSGDTVTMQSSGVCSIVADQSGDARYSAAASQTQSFSVAEALLLAAPTTGLSGTYDTAYTLTLAATGGAQALSYAVVSGSLPSGLSLDSATGQITGLPSAVGTSTFTIRVTDANGASVSTGSFSIVIDRASQANLSVTTTSGTAGTPLTLAVAGGTGTGAVTYTVTGNGCVISGGTISSNSAGICSVVATKAADTNYNSISSSATNVTFAAIPVPAGGGGGSLPPVPPAVEPVGTPPAPTTWEVPVPTAQTLSGTPTQVVGGKTQPVATVVTDDKQGIAVTTTNWAFTLKVAPLPSDGSTPNSSAVAGTQLVVTSGTTVQVAGTEFQPKTVVKVWLYSSPILLGTVEVNADGSFASAVAIPTGLELGSHTLVLQGINSKNEVQNAQASLLVKAAENTSMPPKLAFSLRFASTGATITKRIMQQVSSIAAAIGKGKTIALTATGYYRGPSSKHLAASLCTLRARRVSTLLRRSGVTAKVRCTVASGAALKLPSQILSLSN